MKNSSEPNPKTMPILFIGHGTPMNAIAKNDYTETLNLLGASLPAPKAILTISAHWLTNGTFITSTDTPKIIYDFYGFPDELYKVTYPAPGSEKMALEIQKSLTETEIQLDNGSWGFDHGTWSVLKHLFPKAEVPVLQLSIDIRKSPENHLNLGHQLARLREQGILIVASGNIVHNLRSFSWRETDDVYPWAEEFDSWVKKQLLERNFAALATEYNKTEAGRMSVPSLDHYLPLLHIAGASRKEDKLRFVYEKIQNASIAMRSFIFE